MTESSAPQASEPAPADTSSQPASSTASSSTEASSSTTTSSTTTEPEGIVVTQDEYVGRDLKGVEKDLKELGLSIEKVEADSDRPKEEVIAVQEGTYAPGDTVVVTLSKGPGKGNNEGGDD